MKPQPKGIRFLLDFEGKVDGEVREGTSSTDFTIEIGSGRMIPGFEDGIVGHSANESFNIDVTFPKSTKRKNLPENLPYSKSL